MARPVWKGDISFGLVTIPVSLYSATQSTGQLRFRQLDRADLSPIREKRVSERTGREVEWEDLVKGYEYESGQFVTLDPEDFERANVEATHTVDIVQAVPRTTIPVQYFETPYFLVPARQGRKAYQILRETLRRAERVAVGMIVLRNRQHLAVVMPEGDALMLDLLRYSYELRDLRDLGVDEAAFTGAGISDKELELAGQLVAALEGPWAPEQYRDRYREDLLALIEQKVKTGEAPRAEEEPARRPAEIVDMMELLRRSVEARSGKAGDRRRAGKKSA